MNIIIPMAGLGKRMRPHTLIVPKPLISIAGKPIVQHLIEEIAEFTTEKIEEVAFIIGDFGKEVEKNLLRIANSIGAKGKIYYQHQALGTAHAILCAADSLKGKTLIAFADTLFQSKTTKLNKDLDGIIWVQEVENPSDFGVVLTNENNFITDFVEKPKTPISNLAIIGIYYFKDGAYLKQELQFLIDNNIIKNGEYQLTDALKNMLDKNKKLGTESINEWLDCGNKNATLYANKQLLKIKAKLVDPSLINNNSLIIEPCFIGKNVELNNSIIGPYVSLGDNVIINEAIVKNTIVQTNTKINKAVINNSMLGSFVEYNNKAQELNLGDYSSSMFNE